VFQAATVWKQLKILLLLLLLARVVETKGEPIEGNFGVQPATNCMLVPTKVQIVCRYTTRASMELPIHHPSFLDSKLNTVHYGVSSCDCHYYKEHPNHICCTRHHLWWHKSFHPLTSLRPDRHIQALKLKACSFR
jgi:hypothetical protein